MGEDLRRRMRVFYLGAILLSGVTACDKPERPVVDGKGGPVAPPPKKNPTQPPAIHEAPRRLPPSNALKGDLCVEIVDDAGKPVALKDVSIRALEYDLTDLKPVLEPEGVVRLLQAPIATYEISPSLKAYPEIRVSIRAKNEGKETVRLKIVPAEVSGRVCLGTDPCQGRSVTLASEAIDVEGDATCRVAIEGRTNREGRFEFKACFPGEYRLECGSYVPPNSSCGPISFADEVFFVSKHSRTVARPFTLPTKTPVDLGDAFTLTKPNARFRLRIPGASNLAIHVMGLSPVGPEITDESRDEVYSVRPTISTGTTKDDLTPELPLPSGQYLVSVLLTSSDKTLTVRRIIEVRAGSSTIDVPLPDDRRPCSVVIDGRKIFGQVDDKLFTVLASVTISEGPCGWPAIKDSRTAKDAGLLIPIEADKDTIIADLLPGEYVLTPNVRVTWRPAANVSPDEARSRIEESKKLEEGLRARLIPPARMKLAPNVSPTLEVIREK